MNSFYIIDPERKACWYQVASTPYSTYVGLSEGIGYTEDSFVACFLLSAEEVKDRQAEYTIDRRYKPSRATELTYEEFQIQIALGTVPPFMHGLNATNRYFVYND